MEAAQARLTHDELTGLLDRRSFFALAEEAFGQAFENRADCLAVVIDLDRLEHVNDTYGHHVGSELIREAAAALESVAIEGDILGRLGGDELALLRVSGPVSPEELGELIADEVARASQSDRPYGLEVSVGVAARHVDEVGWLDGLLGLADEDMYRQKRSGGGTHRGPHVRRVTRRSPAPGPLREPQAAAIAALRMTAAT